MSVKTQNQCITVMDAYKNKSIEVTSDISFFVALIFKLKLQCYYKYNVICHVYPLDCQTLFVK